MRGLDLRIEPGERVLLLGASGSGKSTLLAALAGVLGGEEEGEEEGTLAVDGRHPSSRRGRSGYLLQDPDAQVVLARVGDDVAFGCENLGIERTEIWRRVADALDAVGLQVPLEQSTGQLSGGQKQRLALAGLLAMRPGLLLLDEPTANLDPAGVREVAEAVSRVVRRTGSTLVVVEHRVAVWAELVDRVIALDASGSLLADGAPSHVFSAYRQTLADAGVWIPDREAVSWTPALRKPPGSGELSGMLGEHGGSRNLPESGRPPGTPLLSARQLAVGRAGTPPIRDGIDLSIAAGEAIALTGPNGVGKTTLALTLGGLIPPSAGRVDAAPALARGVTGAPISWRSRDLLTRIGSVFQSPEHQLLAATVRQELRVGPRALRLPEPETTARVDELLERLQLARLAEANPFTLSGGQKRRLTVATVLATRPSILILDEPTFGQDARTWRELTGLISGLIGEGHAILAVTHDSEFARALGAREIALDGITVREKGAA